MFVLNFVHEFFQGLRVIPSPIAILGWLLSEWDQAVNAHGRFGRWRADVTNELADILDVSTRN